MAASQLADRLDQFQQPLSWWFTTGELLTALEYDEVQRTDLLERLQWNAGSTPYQMGKNRERFLSWLDGDICIFRGDDAQRYHASLADSCHVGDFGSGLLFSFGGAPATLWTKQAATGLR